MKKSIFVYFILLVILFLIPIYLVYIRNVNASSVKGLHTATVSASIDIDPYSTVAINAPNTEVGLSRDVRVRITDRNGTPLVNRNVVLYTDIPGQLQFVQPPLTDSDGIADGEVTSLIPGVFTVKAKDVTFSTEILIQDTEALYVFPIPSPVVSEEPYYTAGTANTVSCSEINGLDGHYLYQFQVATDNAFSKIVSTSPLSSSLEHTFSGLSHNIMYFYRARAQNSGGQFSEWSDPVFSAQDNVPPVFVYVEGAKMIKIKSSFQIEFKFNIVEEHFLKSIKLFCKTSAGLKSCGTLQVTGNSYTAVIPFEQLERVRFLNYKDSYTFCVSIVDNADRVTQSCNFKIDFEPQSNIPDVPIVVEVVNVILGNINKTLNAIDSTISNYFVGLANIYLTLVGLLLLLLSMLFSLAVLIGNMALIPVFLHSLLNAFRERVGFRSHGAPCGTVYDVETKKPIKYATVYIYDNHNSLLRTDVTDADGLFKARLDTGRYRIVVKRKGYLFPSIIAKKDEDEKYKHVYKGDIVIVSKRNPMNISIPLDPMNMMDNDMKKGLVKAKVLHFIKHLNVLVTVIGLVIAFYAFEKSVNWFNLILLLLYIPVFGIYLKSVVRLNIGMK